MSKPKIDLPFKPFTLDEVKQLTGVESTVLDGWVKAGLHLHTGDDGFTQGLDFMGTFACFVAWRWMHEGAPPGRAVQVLSYVAMMRQENMEAGFGNGNTFPVVGDQLRELCRQERCKMPPLGGMLVPAPDSSLGNRLRLDRLWEEFQHALQRVFPGYNITFESN